MTDIDHNYKSPHLGKFCVCRCTNAGVHCGKLIYQYGQTAEVEHARRIWRWRGANTLNEVAKHGVDEEFSRISEPTVSSITLTDCIEVQPCSDVATENLSRSRWPK